jgi:hypothetical protein
MQLALCTWTVSYGSSSYTGGLQDTMRDLHISDDVAILGISLYVLGFALGYVTLYQAPALFEADLPFTPSPLVFAPMGEVNIIKRAHIRALMLNVASFDRCLEE